MIQVVPTEIPDVKVVLPKKFGDHRGFFSETYKQREWQQAGIAVTFVQDNHSYSADRHVVRGLHFQRPPFAQDKLVRVTRGSILDVAVDLRRSSPTFGAHVAIVVSAELWNCVFIPIGFAHGFCTLEPDTEVVYKVSNYYSPAHDSGVRWNDPALRISWPLSETEAILSERDRDYPLLADLPDLFA